MRFECFNVQLAMHLLQAQDEASVKLMSYFQYMWQILPQNVGHYMPCFLHHNNSDAIMPYHRG